MTFQEKKIAPGKEGRTSIGASHTKWRGGEQRREAGLLALLFSAAHKRLCWTLRTRSLVLLQEPVGDGHRRNEKDKRSNHPHDHCAGALIYRRCDVKSVWRFQVIIVDWPLTKCEKRRQRCIYDVRQHQVGEHEPANPFGSRWPWADEGPPEEDRCGQETEMLEFMPVFVLQGEVVSRRYVPGRESNIHRKPGTYRRLTTSPWSTN